MARNESVLPVSVGSTLVHSTISWSENWASRASTETDFNLFDHLSVPPDEWLLTIYDSPGIDESLNILVSVHFFFRWFLTFVNFLIVILSVILIKSPFLPVTTLTNWQQQLLFFRYGHLKLEPQYFHHQYLRKVRYVTRRARAWLYLAPMTNMSTVLAILASFYGNIWWIVKYTAVHL